MKKNFFLKQCIIIIIGTMSWIAYADMYFKGCVVADAGCETLNLRCKNGDIFGKTFFSVRPIDSNTVRRISEFHNDDNKMVNVDYGHHSYLTFQYQRSFTTSNVGKWFFFNGCQCMTVGIPTEDPLGPFVEDPNAVKVDVDGSQLGLSLGDDPEDATTRLKTGIIGPICNNPLIDSFIVDFDFYFNLDCVCCGLWTRIDVPIARTRTNMRFCASGKGVLEDAFPAGLFTFECSQDPTATEPAVYDTILDAFKGDRPFGLVPALSYGKYCCGNQTKVSVAGVHWDLGYDFHVDDLAYLGASIHVVAPTGTRPKGKYVFEPVIGANKSWQLGLAVELSRLWKGCDEQAFGLYFYGVATHIFKAEQTRLFSLKNNGAGSQYLLLKTLDPSTGTLDGLERAANVFIGTTRIGADFMLDASIKGEWSYCDYFVDLGYNLWVRSHEKRADTVCFRNFEEVRYGIKGNVDTSYFDDFFQDCIGDQTTASQSTICQPAFPDLIPNHETPPVTNDFASVPLQLTDIDFTTPLHPAAFSNKVFASFGRNYTLWNYDSYILVGGDIEIGRRSNALNQWSIMVQGGTEF